LKIKKYLKIWVIINLIIILSYGIVNYKISSRIFHLNNQYSSIQQQELLIFEISSQILNLQALIFQSAIISTTKTIHNFYNNQIEKNIKKIKELLKLLKTGGDYIEKIEANLANKRFIKKEFKIQKSNFTAELNDILTKLAIIEKEIKIINHQNKIQKRRELKLLPSIFNRIIENLNRYLSYTQNQLKEIKQEKNKLFNIYLLIQVVFILTAFLFNFILLWYLFNDIEKLYYHLEYQLYHDNLTKLKNRIALENEIKDAKALIFIDIDDFNDINDVYGTKVGDEFLIEFSKILKKIDQNVYRIGNDEFAICLKEYNKEKIKNIYNKIISQEIELKSINLKLIINVKMGVASYGDLIKNATFSLKIAKQKNIPIYEITLKDIEEEKKRIEFSTIWTQKIKDGIKNDAFVPFYQPIVDKNKNTIKYEVLMRLKENDKYYPPFFLDIAIKNRLYNEISINIFKKAVRNSQMFPISFNISYLDIENINMRNLIYNTLEVIDPKMITFEILENERIKDYNLFLEFISKVKELGANIAIDDFGTGYSNFTRILKIKPDFIKIDGSLISAIVDKNNQNIVKAIISFAKESQIKTIAEFVENEEIFNICKELGIDYFQGYYFSAPKPLE